MFLLGASVKKIFMLFALVAVILSTLFVTSMIGANDIDFEISSIRLSRANDGIALSVGFKVKNPTIFPVYVSGFSGEIKSANNKRIFLKIPPIFISPKSSISVVGEIFLENGAKIFLSFSGRVKALVKAVIMFLYEKGK